MFQLAGKGFETGIGPDQAQDEGRDLLGVEVVRIEQLDHLRHRPHAVDGADRRSHRLRRSRSGDITATNSFGLDRSAVGHFAMICLRTRGQRAGKKLQVLRAI